MEWILTDDEWISKDGFTTILTLSTYNSPETYSVIYPCLGNIMTAFHADSEAEAKWKAVLLLNNRCNEEIAKYMRLRDTLPSFHELYVAAEENE